MPPRGLFRARKNKIASLFFCAIFVSAILSSLNLVESAGSGSSLRSGNSTPTVSAVSLNNGSAITLTANATTTVRVNLTVTDNNGCGEVFFSGYVTTTVLRSGVGEGCTFSYENCYIATTTASSFTHSCPSLTSTQTSANATATFDIYYFAQATDASSSFPSNTWFASVRAEDASSSVHTASSTGIELNTLLAIDTTTSTNYGTVNPGTDTSSTNQIVEVRNAGNSSSSLNINGTAMCNGSICISTSSQHYATSTFTYGGVEQTLQETATLVSGFLAPPQPLGPSWTNTTALPSRLINLTLQGRGNYIYRIGGGDTLSVVTSTIHFAEISSTGSIISWQSGTSIPAASSSHDHASAIYSNYLYMLGGGDIPDTTTTVIFAPINATGSIGTWTNTTPLPGRFKNHQVVTYGGYIAVVGGFISNGGSATATTTVTFAPINATGSIGSWTNTTPLPLAIAEHRAVTYNGYLYVVGGTGSGATTTVRFAPINATGSIGSWQTTNQLSLGSEITNHEIGVFNGFIFVIGGQSSGATSTTRFARINSNGSLGKWQQTTNLTSTGLRFGSTILNGKLYIVGGNRGGSITSSTQFNDLAADITFWGSAAPAGSAQGYYTSTNTFTAVFSP